MAAREIPDVWLAPYDAVATGSGDVPRAILQWADRRQLGIRITGVDLHPHTVREARANLPDPRFTIVSVPSHRSSVIHCVPRTVPTRSCWTTSRTPESWGRTSTASRAS